MTQNRNDRRAGPQSSARPRRPQTQNGSHRAYDWTQDRRASAPQRRTRPQGYQEQTLDFSGGSLRLFAPVLPGSRNCGLAALMSAGEYDILIPGDMPAAAERVLADTHSLPQVEVLVVGHHGAASSTAPELLQTVSPEIAVISVGADNSYGHPAQAVLDRLTEVGAAVYRTDQAGDITITR